MFKPKTTSEKDFEKIQNESLDDETLIDPETGAKISLEQAESGQWDTPSNSELALMEEDITRLYSEEGKEAHKVITHIRTNQEYDKIEFSSLEIELLEQTKILSKYDDWKYSNLYKMSFCDGFVFLPSITILDTQSASFQNDYNESQICFWVKSEVNFGHYYLREKSKIEKFFKHSKNDSDLKLEGYECFTFKRAQSTVLQKQILNLFETEQGLEIEFYENNLFIKNQILINELDFERMERIVKKLAPNYHNNLNVGTHNQSK